MTILTDRVKVLMSVLVTASILVSCSKVERVEKGEKAITMKAFSVPASKVVTGPVSGSYPSGETMGIFIYSSSNSYGEPWTAAPENYFNRPVEFSSEKYASVWTGVMPCYWPESGSLIFAGYSPYKRPVTVGSSDYEKIPNVSFDPAAKTLSIDDYVVCNYVPMSKEDIEDVDIHYQNTAQSDLMFFLPKIDEEGRYIGTNGMMTGEAYNANFRHALALVEFTVKAEDADALSRVGLSTITLHSVYHKGDFSATLTGVDEVAITWKNLETTVEEDIYHTDEFDLSLTPEPRTIAQLLVIPGPTHPVDIEYHVFVHEKLYTQKATFNLAQDYGVETWEAGRRYTYNIVLGVDKMTFSPQTSVWGDESGSHDQSTTH